MVERRVEAILSAPEPLARAAQTSPLPAIDATERRRPGARASGSHFAQHESAPIAHEQVDLQVIHPKVRGEDDDTLRLEPFGDDAFGGAAERVSVSLGRPIRSGAW